MKPVEFINQRGIYFGHRMNSKLQSKEAILPKIKGENSKFSKKCAS